MSTTTAPARVEGTNVVVMRTPTLQWALKRALLGVVILFVTIAAAATLLYASIEPEEEDRPSLTAPADEPRERRGPTPGVPHAEHLDRHGPCPAAPHVARRLLRQQRLGSVEGGQSVLRGVERRTDITEGLEALRGEDQGDQRRLEIARDMAVHAPLVPDWVISIHERTLAAIRSADFGLIDEVMDEHLAQLEQIWERETGRGLVRPLPDFLQPVAERSRALRNSG